VPATLLRLERYLSRPRLHDNRRVKRVTILHVGLPVLAGGLMYLAFRSADHLLFRWADALGLGSLVAMLRVWAVPLRPTNEWILYSLPDALWLYAFVYFMAVTWRGRSLEARLWCALPPALAFGSEIAQGVGLLQGTFAVGDLVAYAAAIGLATFTLPAREVAA
jgi:hypothetical protein